MSEITENLVGRQMPFSLEAEQSVLGSILIDPECFSSLPEVISPEDFYFDEHRQIYNAMQTLFLSSKSIDHVTLIDTLIKQGVYNEEKSNSYIKHIAMVVPSAKNVREYAKIVRNNSKLRQLIEECGEIMDIAYTASEDAGTIIGDAEQRIFALAQDNTQKTFADIKDVLVQTLAQIRLTQQEGATSMTVPTGFVNVDKKLVGMGKSDLVLIGARPGMGKTSFALNIATLAAQSFAKDGSKKAVCLFSLEMSNEQLVQRILASEAMIDSHKLRSGELDDADWKNIATAASVLSELNIKVDDTTGMTITAMKAKLRRERNLGMIIIDYLQLMQSDRRIDNRVNEIGEISRNLKIMAKEFNVPIICCAQLSRASEKRPDAKPVLSDLRDSGAIEQDADIVMFLYREEYYKRDDANPADETVAKVIIAKNRHGEVGEVEVGWIGKYTKFLPYPLSDRVEP